MTTRNKSQRLILASACGVSLLVAAGILQAGMHDQAKNREGIFVGGGERGIEAVVIPGPPIVAEDVMSAEHMSYARGMTCAECHNVTFDGTTSATEQFMANFPQLENDAVWEKIVTFLPGRERFAITTVSSDNEPLATTVDMVLDKDDQVLYVVSEKGTEKLMQLRKNPAIGAVRFKGWTVAERGKQEWRSVQIRGTAEILDSSDPMFMELLERYNLVRLTEARAVRRFDLIRVTPKQIYYFDTELSADSYSPYQVWNRPKS
jgi:nitroimidazol reductase NimA-like FMN-containing flavoprotein (pyridoxamine 5'-phosphate oxidase superfamily)